MKKIRLTESDLTNLVKRVINEQGFFGSEDDELPKEPNRRERKKVENFKEDIQRVLETGGSDWATNVSNPSLRMLVSSVRRICDKYE